MNDFYNHSSWPATGSSGASAPARSEFDAITAGFAKLPALTGNANRAVVINSVGTGMTVTTGALALAGNFTTTGAFNLILALSATVTLTLPGISDTLVGRTTTDTLTNKTLTTPIIAQILTNGGAATLTLPTTTDTLVGRATTDTLTNKTINLANNTLTGTLAQFNTALSDGNFATLDGTETLTNKTLSSGLVSGDPVTALGIASKQYVDASAVPPGTSLDYRGTVIPSGYLAEDGSNQIRSTYPSLFAVLVRSSVVTITIASPGVVSWTAHGLSDGDVVKFSTTGSLPTGLVAGTTYFVVNKTTNDFQVSATEGGAAINTSGSQSGTHTAIHAPYGDGDGSTTFTLPDSRRRASVGRGGTPNATLGARLGATGGEDTHVLTAAESGLPSHVHGPGAGGDFVTGGAGAGLFGGASYVEGTSVSANTASAGGGSGAAHNVIQQSLVVTKIIKT